MHTRAQRVIHEQEETVKPMEIVEPSDLYPPLAPTLPLHGGKTWQPWAWARCASCGAVMAKPTTRDGRKVLSGAGRCVLCGHQH